MWLIVGATIQPRLLQQDFDGLLYSNQLLSSEALRPTGGLKPCTDINQVVTYLLWGRQQDALWDCLGRCDAVGDVLRGNLSRRAVTSAFFPAGLFQRRGFENRVCLQHQEGVLM